MEINDRCRYFPACSIHRGKPVENRRYGAGRGSFSAENRAEMRELAADGWKQAEIAAAFGTSANVVGTILRSV